MKTTKEDILKKHADKICMMGKSVGGAGVFFYVKISNADLLTEENFLHVQDYFINTVFKEINIDTEAKGIVRNQVIPYDPEYFNDKAKVFIPTRILSKQNEDEKQKSIGSGNKERERRGYTSNYTFMDISEVNKIIKWKTVVDTGDADYIIKDMPFCNVFVPRVIDDGQKHKVFRGLVNSVMLNNPGINLDVILGFISYINRNNTDDSPMKIREMVNYSHRRI